MLCFVFGIISFLFQIGLVLSIVGLLAYDARVAWGKESFQDIWEELGQGKGVVQFIFLFLPTAGLFIVFWACEIIKPVAVAVYKAVAVKARKAKKNDKTGE